MLMRGDAMVVDLYLGYLENTPTAAAAAYILSMKA